MAVATQKSIETTGNEPGRLKELIRYALNAGASKAAVIQSADIVVDEALAAMCLEPKCENYGLSKSCPPNVSGPAGFRKRLEKCSQALFFKIDVPSELLFSSNRREIFQLLHETAAGIEQQAVDSGFKHSKAYAGGSCKTIFCSEHADCAVISTEGNCRNPQSARQSMSGFGINVSKLMEIAGWPFNKAENKTDSDSDAMSHVCGLVLIY